MFSGELFFARFGDWRDVQQVFCILREMNMYIYIYKKMNLYFYGPATNKFNFLQD